MASPQRRAAVAPQMRFTSLRLTNWRNFRHVEMSLSSSNFLVGPNASGKSNLIDAFRFLSEIATPGSGGLQAAIARRGGFAAVRSLHARRPSHVELSVSIGTEDAPELWTYQVRINALRKGSPPTVISERVSTQGSVLKDRARGEAGDTVEFSQTSLEQVSVNKDFRPLIDFLSSCRYLHVVPQIVRDRGRAKPEGDDPYGGDLLRRMKSMPAKMREPRLRRMAKAVAIAVPQFDNLTLDDDADGVPHLQASFRMWRATASKQSEAFFSDGTLRLIGLLWSISEPGGPLLLEEPELSLNDGVVAQLPRMFRVMQRISKRQVIATTHSSALLDDTGVGLAEVQRITVDANGSAVEMAGANRVIAAQVGNGMRVSEAVFPLLVPEDVARLGRIDLGG